MSEDHPLDEKGQFLEARLREVIDDHVDTPGFNDVRILVDFLHRLLDMDSRWPILVTEQPEWEMDAGDPLEVMLRVSQKQEWMTRQAYAKIFGEDAPTSPLIRGWLQYYTNHPDFKPEWLDTPQENTDGHSP